MTVPPMLWIPHQLVGVPLGYNVTLECYTEAHPTSLHYWTRDSGQMLHDSSKYKAVSIQGVPSYKVQMKLTIVDVSHTDYGVYKCVAKNSRGETDGTIRLYSESSNLQITYTLRIFRYLNCMRLDFSIEAIYIPK